MACDLIPRLNGLSAQFGIPRELNEDRDLRCVDICTPNVLLIHPFQLPPINIPWPNAAGNLNRNCRSIYDIPTGLAPTNCFFRITCADEELICQNGVPSINVNVTGELVLVFDVNGSPVTWVGAVPLINTTLTESSNWYRTDSGTEIADTRFSYFIRLIDGSCIVATTNCVIDVANQQVVLTANIVEKLWKYENVWVTGVTPYLQLLTSQPPVVENITVPDIFEQHAIPPCITP